MDEKNRKMMLVERERESEIHYENRINANKFKQTPCLCILPLSLF